MNNQTKRKSGADTCKAKMVELLEMAELLKMPTHEPETLPFFQTWF